MQNGIPISWPSAGNWREHGDEANSIERWANMTPELMQKNVAAIQAAWGNLTGQKCGCK
jgi:hypothetical protein